MMGSMLTLRYLLIPCAVLASCRCLLAEDAAVAPRGLELQQPGVQLTMVAEHPAVATPTGIDVDSSGNVWMVASHTHFRPDDYDGPEHDEVVVISPQATRRVFYEQTTATMDLELGEDGWVYLAERDRILRVRDTDGDGVGDEAETLAALETEETYPHNGLAGLAWHPDGDLLFSLGENFKQHWTLRGSDAAAINGTGEGGVFRCRADGTGLRRIAKGFWNPFGLCVRQDGTIFAADNDPGSMPPCRLLHVVEGGEYGYQRLYGSAAFHPFVCWDGELRGTLPMVHPVGEAPCGVAPLGQGLIVPSWTDSRIDFYPLRPVGASFQSERVVLVRGDDQFRPTCIAQASPTVFYLSDWVAGSYQVHSKGRLWKLEIDPSKAGWLESLELAPPSEAALLAERLRHGGDDQDETQLFQLAQSKDPFVARAAVDALAMRAEGITFEHAARLVTRDRVSLLLAIRKAAPRSEAWARHFWNDRSTDVRFETLRWIADEQLVAFEPAVREMLERFDHDYRLFEACLAAWTTLAGNPEAGVADSRMLMERLRDEEASLRTRAFVLRLIDPAHPGLDEQLLDQLLADGDAATVREVVRTLAARGTPEAQDRLLKIARGDDRANATRADAIAGLANPSAEQLTVLLQLTEDKQRRVREEALRSLRFAALDESQRQRLESLRSRFPQSGELITAALQPESIRSGRPAADDTARWRQRLAAVQQPVDLEAGRRIFYHSRVGTCSNCHRRSGRGNVMGPDLSAAASLAEEDRLLISLLQPSRDVAPQYYPRALVTEDGRSFVGILLRDGGGGKEFYRDNSGRERSFQTSEIIMRRELTTSMMPDGLVDTMTDREIRDLLAYLAAPLQDGSP